MAETFEQLWRRLLLYAPRLPVPLAQEFVNTAYSRILSESGWSGLKKEGEFQIPAAYTTGTASVTQNSASVTGSGTTWTSAMVGRQFLIDGAPFYTIASVESATALTLDRVYGGVTAAGQAYTIVLIYLVVPTDFLHFLSVRDVENNWRLHTAYSQDNLDLFDAQRSSTTSPRVLASATPSSAGLPRYEIWPRELGGKVIPFRYMRKPPLMTLATDTPVFPVRGDTIRNGALAQLCLWPGTAEERNPFFDIRLHEKYEIAFLAGLREAIREDQEIDQTAITYADEWASLPWAPLDAAWWQAHA